MEVEIISREIIKPCSSTPHHLRTHRLSLLDQFHAGRPSYIPIILFYSSTNTENLRARSCQLKHSLSETLTHFYPFAGRVQDSFAVDCNDEGAIYYEAQVACDMSTVLKEPEMDKLLQLVPSDLSAGKGQQVMLAIQVNYFSCGGMAICASVSHVVADAMAAASFLKGWAAVACGALQIDDGVVHDCASLFPPLDLSDYWKAVSKNVDMVLCLGNVVTKRFLFDGSSIAAIQKEIGTINVKGSNRPSRFEAVSSLLLSAMIASSIKSNDRNCFSKASVAVNIRRRMNPSLPQNCIGNVVHMTLSEPLVERKMKLSSLAEKIHDSISKLNDDYVRELHAGAGYLNMVKSAVEGFSKTRMFGFTSWCRFPFYETDFGWGKPIWFVTAVRFNRVAVFLDAKDGEGIEAWITLTPAEMAKLELDTGILAYASFKPSIYEN